jgi:hypothetical protein
MKRMISTLFFALMFCVAFAQEIEIPKEQKSLVTKLTATWCPICGASAWDTYANLVQNVEGKAVLLAAHYSSSSDLHSTAAYELIQGYNGTPSGQPVFYFNRDRVPSSVEAEVTRKVDEAIAGSPLAQTGIRLEYDQNSKELVARTRTQFFEATEGAFFLSLLLVEREVLANQSGRGSNAQHKRVVRDKLTSETLGDEIASGTIPKDATFDLTVRTPMNSSTDAAKYQVVAILWQQSGNSREFVNTNFRSQLDPFTTSTASVIAQPVSMTVQPNPVADQTAIRISGKKALGPFRLNLYTVNGQLLRSWQENNFSGSTYNLELDRNDLPQSGIYFLQMVGEQGILNEKIVVR